MIVSDDRTKGGLNVAPRSVSYGWGRGSLLSDRVGGRKDIERTGCGHPGCSREDPRESGPCPWGLFMTLFAFTKSFLVAPGYGPLSLFRCNLLN